MRAVPSGLVTTGLSSPTNPRRTRTWPPGLVHKKRVRSEAGPVGDMPKAKRRNDTVMIQYTVSTTGPPRAVVTSRDVGRRPRRWWGDGGRPDDPGPGRGDECDRGGPVPGRQPEHPVRADGGRPTPVRQDRPPPGDRKSTRLNSSH